jgi:hypothetical protein
VAEGEGLLREPLAVSVLVASLLEELEIVALYWCMKKRAMRRLRNSGGLFGGF